MVACRPSSLRSRSGLSAHTSPWGRCRGRSTRSDARHGNDVVQLTASSPTTTTTVPGPASRPGHGTFDIISTVSRLFSALCRPTRRVSDVLTWRADIGNVAAIRSDIMPRCQRHQTCSAVCLLSRDGVDGRMTVGRTLALGGRAAVASPRPAATSAAVANAASATAPKFMTLITENERVRLGRACAVACAVVCAVVCAVTGPWTLTVACAVVYAVTVLCSVLWSVL